MLVIKNEQALACTEMLILDLTLIYPQGYLVGIFTGGRAWMILLTF